MENMRGWMWELNIIFRPTPTLCFRTLQIILYTMTKNEFCSNADFKIPILKWIFHRRRSNYSKNNLITDNKKHNRREKTIGLAYTIYRQPRSRYIHCDFLQIFLRSNFASSRENNSSMCQSVSGLCQIIYINTCRYHSICYTLLRTRCKQLLQLLPRWRKAQHQV
jgi:hypothetical protein